MISGVATCRIASDHSAPHASSFALLEPLNSSSVRGPAAPHFDTTSLMLELTTDILHRAPAADSLATGEPWFTRSTRCGTHDASTIAIFTCSLIVDRFHNAVAASSLPLWVPRSNRNAMRVTVPSAMPATSASFCASPRSAPAYSPALSPPARPDDLCSKSTRADAAVEPMRVSTGAKAPCSISSTFVSTLRARRPDVHT
mmetsp:Transcript_35367/g.42567  ORF Transcript_35367/g.42567 Transcript_35367/m.42567 type:complete len:200 (-) Transcript_35367:4253-4852(-)